MSARIFKPVRIEAGNHIDRCFIQTFFEFRVYMLIFSDIFDKFQCQLIADPFSGVNTPRVEHCRFFICLLYILGDFNQYNISLFIGCSYFDHFDQIGILLLYLIKKVETLLVRLVLVFHAWALSILNKTIS